MHFSERNDATTDELTTLDRMEYEYNYRWSMDGDNAKHIRSSGSYAMAAILLTNDCLATFIAVHRFPARAKKFSIP